MEPSKLSRLKNVRRRAVVMGGEDLVRTSFLEDGNTLPLVVQPAVEGVALVEWAGNNLELIERWVREYGGILFRGFEVPTVEMFYEFAGTVCPQLVNYFEGSSPRISVQDKVYTSTEYPPELFVSLHNELSYSHKWPRKIFFHCAIEPQEGGETPIADSRKVLQLLDPEVRDRFVSKGVRYVRNLHGGRGAGLAWQTVFETDDRAKVEAFCREGNIDFRWKDDGGLWTSQQRPSVARHPYTGEVMWFNQADQFHPSNLGEEEERALRAVTPEENLPINSYYGDGTPFGPGDLEAVRDACARAMVRFPWRRGDVTLLDNMLTAHGRMPFRGPRRIVVAMGETVTLDQAQA